MCLSGCQGRIQILKFKFSKHDFYFKFRHLISSVPSPNLFSVWEEFLCKSTLSSQHILLTLGGRFSPTGFSVLKLRQQKTLRSSQGPSTDKDVLFPYFYKLIDVQTHLQTLMQVPYICLFCLKQFSHNESGRKQRNFSWLEINHSFA